MKYADGSATIKFEGGPIDGETHFLTPIQYRHGRVVFAVMDSAKVIGTPMTTPSPSIGFSEAVYVPHPSDPANVWVLDWAQTTAPHARRSPHVARLEPEHDRGTEVTIFGYRGRLLTVDDVHDVLDTHRLIHARDPERIVVHTELRR